GDVHRRVGDIHVIHIGPAHAISRNIDFSGRQWKPSNAGRESRATANEGYESWSPNRANHNRSRHPEPATACESPASVVERSKSPRLIFAPSPSPGPDICPVAKSIRSPTDDHGARPPASSVSGDV